MSPSTRRTSKGGWVKPHALPTGHNGRALCRWCALEVPPRRRSFCSEYCVHEWRLRTDPGYLRDQVLARDRGICAACGVDTEVLRKQFRKLDYRARRQFLKEWGLKEGWRRSLWDADHAIPVAEGGGECDLSNMRTLCLKCHRLATTELRRRLSRQA
jgi:5-methylcytosine-specific restriction protein A